MKRRIWSKTLVDITPLPRLMERGGLLIFLSISILILCFSFFSPRMMNSLSIKGADLLSPAVGLISAPVQDVIMFTRELGDFLDLRKENEALKAENTKLREWYQRALSLQTENQSLREVLEYTPDRVQRYITTRVLSDGAGSFAKTLLLDAGRERLVKKDAAVMSAQGLIGRVVDVGAQSARVLLVNDMNSRVPVLVEGMRRHAVMAGQNTDRPTLLYLPEDANIENGRRVVTSGYGDVFPAGLAIGRVVLSEQGQADVQLFTDFTRLLHVRIVDTP